MCVCEGEGIGHAPYLVKRGKLIWKYIFLKVEVPVTLTVAKGMDT